MELSSTKFKQVSRINAHGEPWLDITDEYVEWLCSANAGWLNRGNLFGFEYGIRNMPEGTSAVEIGSYLGLSTNLIGYYKRTYGRKERLVTCDCWTPYAPANAVKDVKAFARFTRETYIHNISMFSPDDLPYTIEARSDGLFAAWREGKLVNDVLGRPLKLGGPIGFCYIDALHSYEASKADFLNCHDHLAVGGYVLFDDTSDSSKWGAKQTVKEIMERPDYELVCKNPNYFFMKKAA